MAINFTNGDVIVPNTVYVAKTLTKFPSSPILKQAIAALGYLNGIPSTVVNMGNLTLPVRSFIHVVPNDISHRLNHGGRGIIIYFETDVQLNNSIEISTSFIKDRSFLEALNNSGSLINKNDVIRLTGFDAAMQLPTITLADATDATSAVVFGISSEDIADGQVGSILNNGSVQVDTSLFLVGEQVFLSDTPGKISTTAGTVSATVGRVLLVGASGAMSFKNHF